MWSYLILVFLKFLEFYHVNASKLQFHLFKTVVCPDFSMMELLALLQTVYDFDEIGVVNSDNHHPNSCH